MNNYAFLGVVRQGRFIPLATEHPTKESLRLTRAPVNGDQPPEDEELSLAHYEGKAILVRGFDDEEWIYSAIVVEEAGLILTAVVQQVFGFNQKKAYRLKYPFTESNPFDE